MTFLVTNPDNHTDDPTFELDGADSITSADVGGFTYVFIAGGVDDGVSVFRLNANGTLTSVFNITDDLTLKLDGATGLSTAMVDGNTYLFAAGTQDNGVSVFRVGTNGSLTSVANAADDGTMFLSGITDTATAKVGTSTYLFTAGTGDDGVSIFRVLGNGHLTNIGNLADNGTFKLDGVDALTTVIVGGTSYLIAVGGVDDGISVFSIAANGTLTNTNNFTDNGTLNLNGASDVTTAVIAGTTYVFVAGAADNGISVFSLDGVTGVLTSVSNFTDTAGTLIAGAAHLSISQIGTSTYLLVGGTESGLSMFRVEDGSNSGTARGTLTFIDNIAEATDAANRELAGTVTTGSASSGGTTYFLGAGQTDDGVSSFRSTATGQLYYLASGNPTDTRIAFLNNDGGNQTSFVDNNPGADLKTTFPEEVGVDTAAGLYFAIVNGNPALASGAFLVRGSLAGGAVTTIADYTNTADDGTDDTIVNAMHIDVINHRIYVGLQDAEGDANQTGIRQYTYNPMTGAVTDNGFILRADTDATKPTPGGGSFDIIDARDFDLDPTMGTSGTLFFTELLTGNAGANTQGLYRMDLNTHAVTLMVSTANVVGGFPSGQNNPTDFTRGYIVDVEVDTSTDLVYFSVESQHAFGNAGYDATQNAIWFVAEGASGAVATQLTLIGLPGGGHFYPGDMVFDQATRQLYVESEESDTGPAGGDTDDVIYVFQLNGAGTQGTLINTISLIPTVINNAANIDGMYFNNIPVLANINGTASHAGEQSGTAITLLTGAPTITDTDGDHLSSATVQISQGLFSSNESNATDDHLSVLAAALVGTNITASFNAATLTLTLSGYDTLAHYQTVLAAVQYSTTGDNPTNFGLDTTRTFTWTVSDGALGVPGGSQNSATTSITIDAVNDAPVNTVPGGQSTNEDTPKAITGISLADPDANPAITNVTVTLTVQHGILTLLTNVTEGLTAGQIAGNGTATVTITAPLNDINATLANANGLTYTNIADYNGSDTLHIVTNDGGNTGSGGAQSDNNPDIAITINPVADIVNDAVTVAEDSGANHLNGVGNPVSLLANDSFENATRFISSVTQGTHGTVTINDNGTAGNTADDYVVYTVTDANFNGTDSFQYTVTSPAGVFETATVNVTITAVNDPVTNTTPTSGSVDEDVSIAITGMSIADVDATLAPAGVYEVTLSAQHGTLTLGTLTGLTFTGGSDGTADATMTFHGTLAAINTALATASYLSNLNYNGAEQITFAVTDLFGGVVATGSGSSTSDSHNYNFTVNAVNDAPVNTVPGTQTVAEDASLTFAGANAISVADVDANGADVTVTVTVQHGTLTVGGNAGLTTLTGDGTATVQIVGNIGAVNNALNGLLYAPAANYNGSDTLQITTNDNGNTGSPGALQDVDSVTINVTAVNDPVTGAAPASLSLAEDATNVAVAGLSISDVDATLAPAGVYEVTLSATHGTLTLTTLTGLTFTGGSDGTADATMTFHGTLAAINTALATATYTPAASYNGAATITLNVTDTFGGVVATGTGLATSDSDVVNVTVDAVNDPVTTSAPPTLTTNEDATSVAVAGLSISDVDTALAPAGVYEVTLSATHGTLTLTTLTGLTFTGGSDGTADATMTFHGTLADINTALATASYTPDANYNGAAQIQLQATDTFGGIVATGTGLATSDSDIVSVTVNAVNDTPVVALAASGTSTEQVAAAVDASAAISDIDLDALNGGAGDYAGATLTIANNGGNDANDLFAIGSSGLFTVNGSNLEAGGLVFATFTGGNGTPLVITFTSSGTAATTALVNAVAQAVQYTYTADTPPASIDVAMTLNDGAPANAGQGSVVGHPATGSDIIHLTITDTPENAPPVVDLNTGTGGLNDTNLFVENGSASGIGAAISVTDAEGDDIQGATITITDPSAGDLLSVTLPLPPGITVSGASTATTLILVGTASASAYETALGQVGYANTGEDPTAGGNIDRQITVTVSDATGTSMPATMTMNIAASNDEPTLVATGASVTLTEGGAAVDLFSGVTASTVESGQSFTSMTLTVSNATDGAAEVLSFDGSNVALTNGNAVTTATNGLNVTVSIAAGTATVTFSGATLSAAQLQTLVDGLTYTNTSQNPTDADRVVTITQLVDSGANGGADDNTLDTSIAATVNVDPINDAPVLTLGTSSITILEDGGFTIFGAGSVTVADVDASTLEVTLSVAHGTLTVFNTAGLSFTVGDGTNDTTMTFSGTASAINAALSIGIGYQPDADYNGSDTMAVSVTDNGETGAGGVQTDSDSLAITITSVNDAPQGANNTVTGSEDDPYVFTATDFGFSDPHDSPPNNFLAVKITTLPGAGTLFLDSDGAGGNPPVAVTAGQSISITDINAGHLYFQPVMDAYGTNYASFTFQVQDDGGTAAAGAQDMDQSANTITIDITPDDLPPVVDLDSGTAGVNYTTSFTEDGAAVAIGSGISVIDQDLIPTGSIESARVTLTDAVAGDVLAFTTPVPAGFTAVVTSAAGMVTIDITGTGTGADYQAILSSLVYLTTSQDPDFGGTDTTRTITVTVNDGALDSAVATTTVNINAVDDAPVAQPDAFTITESGTISGASLFADNGSGADTDPDDPTLTIAAVNGSAANVDNQITLASGALLTVHGNGTFDYDPNGVFLPTPTAGSGASNTPSHDSFDYTLAGGNTVTVTITLTGLDTDDLLLGTAGVDVMSAGGGNDYLDGLGGADIMFGQTGNDAYAVDNAGDQANEAAGEGTDIVLASVSYQLAAGTEIEILSTASNAGIAAINLVGNELDQVIYGNAGANYLDGGTGTDTLVGLGGNDSYLVDGNEDVVIEAAGGGNDIVYALSTYVLTAGAEVEVLSTTSNAGTAAMNLTGNELDQTIYGNNGDNVLDGGGGTDVLVGLGGNDIYYVDGASDFVGESVGGGTDLVYSLTSYTLAAAQEVEILSTTSNAGTGSINLTGNEFGQTIYGNAGVNILDGGAGADILVGLGGNDTYYVDQSGDMVYEAVGGGNDAVYASGSFALGAGQEVELLAASDFNATTPLNLTGNEFANTIYGNNGNNVLDGKDGNDLLVGQMGADTFAFTTALGANNVDVVFGFDHNVDRIALDDAIFTAVGPLGVLNPTAFVVGAAAADASDRIIYNNLTGQLFYDADGTGAGAQIQFATLSPGLTLSASDFQVI